MEKVKINLVSGTSIEKPIVTAFKSNNSSYVVIDNEMNGTMGLPIILVSKLDGSNLAKIEDQNEWGAVKEVLRMIIAGSQVDYINVGSELSAPDAFFSQLTLPVASFDTLKNSYKPASDTSIDSSVVTPTPQVANETPVVEATPVADATINQAPAVEMPNVADVTPITPEESVAPQVAPIDTPVNTDAVATPVMDSAPAVEMPTPSPVMPEPPIENQTVAEVVTNQVVETPVVDAAPIVEPAMPSDAVTPEVPVDFTADKEAFLKACENMFDALVAKFKN